MRREKANGARCANVASAAAAAARLRTTTASAGRLHLTRAGVKRGSQASCAYLIHAAVRFASFFLTTPLERRLNTALPGADPTEMMQDYPLHVSERITIRLAIGCLRSSCAGNTSCMHTVQQSSALRLSDIPIARHCLSHTFNVGFTRFLGTSYSIISCVLKPPVCRTHRCAPHAPRGCKQPFPRQHIVPIVVTQG